MSTVTHETVRQAFAAYHDAQALMRTPLAHHGAIDAMLLDGDTLYPLSRGLAVRVLLNWAMHQLLLKGNKTALLSHDVLQRRYIDRLSVAEFARRFDLHEQTIEARRKSATKRVQTLLTTVAYEQAHTIPLQRQLIQLRYAACSPEQQSVLRLAVVVAEPFERSAEFIPSPNAPKSVAELTQCNLIQQIDGLHITIHPQVSQVVGELVSAEDRQQWLPTIAAYYNSRQQPFKAIEAWLSCRDDESAIRRLLTLDSQLQQAHIERFRTLAERVTKQRVNPDAWCDLQITLGELAESAEQLDAARRNFERALAARTPYVQAQAHYGLARINRIQQDASLALLHTGAVRKLLTQLSAEREALLYAQTLLLEASIRLREQQDADEAEEILDTIRPIFERYDSAEWTSLRANLHTALGMYHYLRGNGEQVIENYWQAWVQSRAADDVSNSILTAHNLGGAYFFIKSDYERALSYYQESQQLAIETGNTHAAALNYKGFGYCYWAMGRFDEAVDAYLETYQYAKGANNRSLLASTCADLVEALATAGRLVEARSYLQEGNRINQGLGDKTAQHALEKQATAYPELSESVNERQLRALAHLRSSGKLTNRVYQELNQIAGTTALRELRELTTLRLCHVVGKGRAARYELGASPP